MISPLLSTASPVTCELFPLIVSTTSPLRKSQSKTSVSIPPETIPPSGNRSEGGIQANGPTKPECPTSVLERTYPCFFSGFCVQNLTVRSLEDVAIPALPQIQMPRTCWRVNHDKSTMKQVCSKCKFEWMFWQYGRARQARLKFIRLNNLMIAQTKVPTSWSHTQTHSTFAKPLLPKF